MPKFLNDVLIGVGSVSSPGLAFAGYEDTGIYRTTYSSNKDSLEFAIDGVRKARVFEAGFESFANVYFNGDLRTFGDLWHATTGTTGKGFAFSNTADSNDVLTISSTGNAVFLGEVEAASLDINGNADISGTLTSGQLTASSSAIAAYFNGTGQSYVQGALAIQSSNADTPEARGQGVFMFNQGKDSTWYMGTRYQNADEWQVGREAGTSIATISATTAKALLKISNAGVATFTGTGNGQVVVNSAGACQMDMLNAQSEAYLRTITNHDLHFRTNNTNKMVIKTTGKVGVGTTTPIEKFDTPNIVIGGSTISGSYGANKLFIDNSAGRSRFYSTGADGTTSGTYTFNVAASDGNPNTTILTLNTTGAEVTGELQATTLDINGTGDISGSLNIGGNLSLATNAGIQQGAYNKRTLLSSSFTHGTANLGAILRFPNQQMQGFLKITLSGSYSNQNITGELVKIIPFGFNQNNNIWGNGANYSVTAVGGIADNFTIGDIVWNGTTSTYDLPIYHITSTGNVVKVILEYFGGNADQLGNVTLTSPASVSIPSAYNSRHNTRVTGNLEILDNSKFLAGTGNDLQIYHDGSNSYISDTGNGDLKVMSNRFWIKSPTDEAMARFTADGASELFHNNISTFVTTATGIDVTGEVKGDTLNIDGNAAIDGQSTFTSSVHPIVINRTGGSTPLINLQINGTSEAFWGATGSKIFVARDENAAEKFSVSNAGVVTATGSANISGSLLVATATDYYSGCQIGVGDTGDSQNGLSITTATDGNGYVLFGDGTGASSYIGQIRYDHSNDTMALQSGNVVRLTLGGTKAVNVNGTLGVSGTSRFGNTVTIVGTNSTNQESVLLRGISANDGDLLGSIRTANTGGYNQEMRFYTSNADGTSDEDLILSLKPDLNAVFTGELEAASLDINGAADISGNLTLSGAGAVINQGSMYIQDANGGRIGFNRNTSTGAIHDTNFNAFQVQSNVSGDDGMFEIQAYLRGNGGYGGSFFINKAAQPVINDYIVHNGDDNTYFGFENNDEFRVVTAGAQRLKVTTGVDAYGYLQSHSIMYIRDSISIMNKAGDAFLPFIARDTSGSEVVMNISNVGTLTAAGKITGTELEGTSLDINGAADISGNLTITGAILNNIENGSLDLYGGADATNDAHIKLYGNNSQWASIVMDHGYDATNSKFIVNQGGTERFKIQNNVAYFSGKIQGAGEIEGTSLDINGSADISTNLVVGGNLSVTGTTTTVNQTNLDVSDNIIGLNRSATSNSNDSGLIIERGSTGDNAAFVWDESIGYFSFGTTQKTPSATGAVANESDWTWKPIKALSAVLTSTLTTPNLTIGSDATTAIGKEFLKIPDVSAVSYAQINANETVSLLSASQLASAIGAATADTTLTVAMSFQLTANTWTDTGINSNELASGTHAMQVYVDDHNAGGGHYDEYYSATISWWGSGTNSTNHDEIVTHGAGHASNASHLQFRTLRHSTGGDDLMLQVKQNFAHNTALNGADGKTMTFKFRKLI